jgi:hypothetical protein
MLREQVERTPPPQWVRVIGGFNAFQFCARRRTSSPGPICMSQLPGYSETE